MAGPLATMADLDAAMASVKATATANAQRAVGESTTSVLGGSGEDSPEIGRLSAQLSQAEERKRAVEGQLQQRQAQDAVVADKYRGLLGSPEERDRLNATLANPAAPAADIDQARQRLAQMRQASDELAPLRREVEETYKFHFTQRMEELRTLDGMDEQSHQALFKAPTGVEALKVVHAAGKKARAAELKGEIALLKGQLSALQGQLGTARGTSLAGAKVPWETDANGLPTEAAIEAGRRGQLRREER